MSTLQDTKEARKPLVLPEAVFDAWDAELEVWFDATSEERYACPAFRGRRGPESLIRLPR